MRYLRRLLLSPMVLGSVAGAAVATVVVRTDPQGKDTDPSRSNTDLAGAMIVFVPLGGLIGSLYMLGRRYRIVRR